MFVFVRSPSRRVATVVAVAVVVAVAIMVIELYFALLIVFCTLYAMLFYRVYCVYML